MSAVPPDRLGGPRSVLVEGVDKSFGDTSVLRGIDLEVQSGEALALLGPSGCGKTTLLRLIAGLERPDAGRISIGEESVADDTVWVPPERRRVGMVFQDWALFQHLSVGRNVGYGLPRAERDGPRVIEALEMVGMAAHADRMPDTLSGGQQQRVALARALAPRPPVLLLDEPFSNLDAALRAEVRTEVRALLGELGVTSIFVTHDQTEAFVLGDRVAVMSDGRIEQLAPARELYARPTSAWIASFVGEVNLLAGDASGATAMTPIGSVELVEPRSGRVQVLVRPEELQLSPGGDSLVRLVEFHGPDQLVEVELATGERLRARVSSQFELAAGDSVSVARRPGRAMAVG